MDYKILAYSTRFVVEVFSTEQYYFAMVAIETGIGWKVYQGIFQCNEGNEDLNNDHPDLQRLAGYGRKVQEYDKVEKIFPQFDKANFNC